MKNRPLVSFCLATYKRPEFLRSTLNSILAQTYTNFEIIVSDNDPAGSARKIVSELDSPKIIYKKNKKNIGMVDNFNNAYSYAKGDFITFIADDDPLKPNMLSTLLGMYKKNPECDSFYGACEIYMHSGGSNKNYYLKNGTTTLLNKYKKNNEITIYDKQTFLYKFFRYEILPYFLWSTGIAKKSLVKKIGGMPEFGSAFLTDFAFITLLGANGKMAVINIPLGGQTIHGDNHGRSINDLQSLNDGILGFHSIVIPFLNTKKTNLAYRTFISNWTITHLVNSYGYYRTGGENSTQQLFVQLYDNLIKNLSFFKVKKQEFLLRLKYPVINLGYLMKNLVLRNLIIIYDRIYG